MSPTITIDTASEPGAWARAIRDGGLQVSEHCASDRQPDGARGEVESVPVHAILNTRAPAALASGKAIHVSPEVYRG